MFSRVENRFDVRQLKTITVRFGGHPAVRERRAKFVPSVTQRKQRSLQPQRGAQRVPVRRPPAVAAPGHVAPCTLVFVVCTGSC